MQLIAQITQAHALIARDILLRHTGQATGQTDVGVIAALELQQFGEQRAPLALGDAHGEQHQERVQPSLLDHQAALPQELADHRRRNPALAEGATGRQSRHHQRDLDRVEQHIIVGHAAKAVPVGIGLQQPVLGDDPLDALCRRRLPDRKPPVIGGNVLAQVSQRPAKTQGFVEHFLQQRTPGRPFHHRRRHIQRGDDAVLRRGRDVHHEGFVEAIPVQLPRTAIAHVNHRCLTEGRQQLVGRMGGEHQRAVFITGGAHAVAPGKELMKRCIGVPGLVEVQHLNAIAQLLPDQLGVVAEAVIGRIGHHRELDLR
ncbi:hypothetical protein D3C86_1278050 [compost metagenome]